MDQKITGKVVTPILVQALIIIGLLFFMLNKGSEFNRTTQRLSDKTEQAVKYNEKLILKVAELDSISALYRDSLFREQARIYKELILLETETKKLRKSNEKYSKDLADIRRNLGERPHF